MGKATTLNNLGLVYDALQVGDLLLRDQDQCLSVPADLIELATRTSSAIPLPLRMFRKGTGHAETLSVHGGKLGVGVTAF